MNILFINCTYRLFDGIDCGAANRSTMFVKALSKLGHVDVVSFCEATIKSNIPNCEVIDTTYIKPKYDRSFREKMRSSFRLLLNPFNPMAYYKLDKQCEAIVDGHFGQKQYDIVACRYIGEAVRCGLQKYSDKLVVDVDDNLTSASLRDYRMGHFKNMLTKCFALYKAYAIGWMSRCFLKKIRVSFYSNILEPTAKKSVFLHNVTSIQAQNKDVTETTPYRLLLVGWLDFDPNKYGALYFVNNVFPKIKSKIPNVELHIVGKTKDERLRSQLNSVEGVKALGFVEDIMAEYENCRVIIVPVYQGAGTSVKFVEGLMMNRPMVSTPMGVRGFEVLCRPSREYLLAKDDEEFALNVIKLLQNPKLAKNIAYNAYQVGIDNFSADRFEKIVEDSIKKEFTKS